MTEMDETVILSGGPLDGDTWRVGDVWFSGEHIVFSVWGGNEYYRPVEGQEPATGPRVYEWAGAK